MAPISTEQPPVTEELLRKMAGVTGPCITIVLPAGAPADFERAKKHAIEDVRKQLTNGYSEAAPLLKAIEKADIHSPEGAKSLLIYSAEGVFEQFSAKENLAPCVHVNHGFELRPLLALQEQNREFYILALSQRHPRLLRCTNSTSEEVPFPAGTPLNLDAYMETRKPDHMLDGMSKGGPSTGSMRGVMFGTNADAHDHNDYIVHYFGLLDRAVCHLLNGSGAPLVPVSVEKELADYKRVNTYPHLVEPGVHGAPDGLKGGEMHKRALEMLRMRPAEPVRKLLNDFDKLVGTAHASVHAQEIIKATFDGRVAHLFLQASAEYRGAFDGMRQKVKRHADELDHPRDLMSDAVLETLRHAGTVTVLDAAHMPSGVPVAAVYRYAAPQ